MSLIRFPSDIKPMFSGHETFPLRQLWLRKAFCEIVCHGQHAPKGVFSDDDAIERFGVGKNMVSSIRHWALACDVIRESKEVEGFEPGDIGNLLFGEQGCDPYLERDATIWLVHWLLAGRAKRSATWYIVFNFVQSQSFQSKDIVSLIAEFASTLKQARSDTTLIRDVEVCLRCYTSVALKNVTEDSAEPLLSDLGLLSSVGNNTYHFHRGPQYSLPDGIFVFALLDFWRRWEQSTGSSQATLSFNMIAHDYSHDESLAFERVCRKQIENKLALINSGKTLLSQGTDPRAHAGGCWGLADSLWYVANVLGGRYLGKRKLCEGWHAQLDAGTYPHLYPEAYDLLPFAILLSIKTGLNRESILNLRRDCIQGESSVSEGIYRLRFTKERGVMSEMEIFSSSTGNYSPIMLIRTLLHITAPLVSLVEPKYADHLFLCFHKKSRSQNPHISLQQLSSGIHGMISGYDRNVSGKTTRLKGWLDQFELKASDGNSLLWNFTRGRKVKPNRRYAEIGNLAHISRNELKHHGTSGTIISGKHYLANKSNRARHDQTIRDAQEIAYKDIRPPVLDTDGDPAKASSALASLAGITTDNAEGISCWRSSRGRRGIGSSRASSITCKTAGSNCTRACLTTVSSTPPTPPA